MTFCPHFVVHLHVSFTDAHILSCNFTIKSQTEDGEHWCQVQCSVDGVPFYQYNDNKAMDLRNLEKEVNSPKKCADLSQKLKDTGEEWRKQLLAMEHEAILTRGKYRTVCKGRGYH